MKQRLIRLIPILLILTLCSCHRVKAPPAGQIEGNRYKNEFLNIQCALPEEFSVRSAEQLAEMNRLSDSSSGTDSESITRETAESLYDFFAVNQINGSNLTVEYIHLKVRFGTLETDEAYLSAMKDYIVYHYGITEDSTTQIEPLTAAFLGENRPGFFVTGIIDEATAYYERMICIQNDDYMAVITAVTVNTDDTEALLDTFTKLN